MGHGKLSSKIQGLVNINGYKMSNYIIYMILNLSLILSSILKHTVSTKISIMGSLENVSKLTTFLIFNFKLWAIIYGTTLWKTVMVFFFSSNLQVRLDNLQVPISNGP